MKSLVLSYLTLFYGASFFIHHTKYVAIASSKQCCLPHWTLHNESCYIILNITTANENASSKCVELNTELSTLPPSLCKDICYSAVVWTAQQSGNNEVVKANICKSSHTNTSDINGASPLCKMDPNNTCPTLKREPKSRFDEGRWFIPNSIAAFRTMKNHSTSFWIGLYKYKGHFYWGDGTRVSVKELCALPINTYNGNDTRCAVYQNHTVTFIQCGCRKHGLEQAGNPDYSFGADAATPCEENTHSTTTLVSIKTTSVESAQSINESGTTTATSHVTTEPNEVNTSTVHVEHIVCNCTERRTVQETKEELRKLFPRKNETSRYKRSKISIPDERRSSQVIGSVAVIVMVVPVLLIVSADVISFIQSPFFKSIFRKGPDKIQVLRV